MMENPRSNMIIGAVLLLLAVLILVIFQNTFLGNPEDNYVFKGNYFYGGEYPCYLDDKEYEVWYLNDDNPNEVAVYDEVEIIFHEDNIESASSVSAGGKTYHRIGSFDCKQEAEYWIYAEQSCVLYITQGRTVDYGDICFVSIALFAIAFIGNGIYLWNKERKELSNFDDLLYKKAKSMGLTGIRSSRKGKALFPGLYPCPGCKTRNLILKPGLASCSTCKSQMVADDQGRILTSKEDEKKKEMIYETRVCTKCNGKIQITSLERPIKVACPECYTSFMLKEKPEQDLANRPETTEGSIKTVAVKIPIYGTKTCPKCEGEIPIHSKERPMKVSCPDCSTSYTLKEKARN